jgi:nitrate/TMAO reductase-like tetraheme cytochrome c subunit
VTVTDEPRKPTRGRLLLDVDIPRTWIVGMAVAIVAIIVLAGALFSVMYGVESCANCHVVRAEVETYKKTAHYAAGVSCQQCHTKPGVFNYFVRNLQGASNILAYVSDQYQRPVTAYVGADNCVQCHPKEQIEKDQVFGNIRVNHTGLREAGYQCLRCHANISHPGTQLEVARVAQNRMSICAECHDGEQLPDTCNTCHVGGAPAEEIDVPIQGHVTSGECRGCHEQASFCAECHNGLTMPHPPSWQRSHGDVVNDRGKSVCASCHTKEDPRFCIDCHGLAIPHPSGFRTNHGGFAQNNRSTCVKCHGRNSCIRCHGLPMPHPAGFVSTHPSIARSSSGLCTRCHSSSFCTSCHGVSLPHGSSFIANHPNAVYSNGSVCVKCHGNNGTGPSGCYGGECHANGFNP